MAASDQVRTLEKSLAPKGASTDGKRTLAVYACQMADDEMTEEDRVLTKAYTAAAQLADACGELRIFDSSVGRYPAHHLMNYLMTELWDHGFSQSEIRASFMEALSDMNRYAAGEERRS